MVLYPILQCKWWSYYRHDSLVTVNLTRHGSTKLSFPFQFCHWIWNVYKKNLKKENEEQRRKEERSYNVSVTPKPVFHFGSERWRLLIGLFIYKPNLLGQYPHTTQINSEPIHSLLSIFVCYACSDGECVIWNLSTDFCLCFIIIIEPDESDNFGTDDKQCDVMILCCAKWS